MAEYIDKNALNDAIREAVRKYPNTFYSGLEVARQIVHDMDAADVQPVRRGRWERPNGRPRSYMYKCSECREISFYLKHEDCKYRYCPWCGAQMTEGEQDG